MTYLDNTNISLENFSKQFELFEFQSIYQKGQGQFMEIKVEKEF